MFTEISFEIYICCEYIIVEPIKTGPSSKKKNSATGAAATNENAKPVDTVKIQPTLDGVSEPLIGQCIVHV